MKTLQDDQWNQSNLQVFWGEIAPCDHILQIYENDKIFLDSLEGFVGSGLLGGDSVIVIATSVHLSALNSRLQIHGFNLDEAKASNLYIPLDAQETLSKFMVDGWPDEQLFFSLVRGVIQRAKGNGRKVRAFGEMVAILWAQGNNGATVKLEHLWNAFSEQEDFSLFCAYPKIGFTQDAVDSITDICKCHTKIIAGWAKPSTEIYYKEVSSI